MWYMFIKYKDILWNCFNVDRRLKSWVWQFFKLRKQQWIPWISEVQKETQKMNIEKKSAFVFGLFHSSSSEIALISLRICSLPFNITLHLVTQSLQSDIFMPFFMLIMTIFRSQLMKHGISLWLNEKQV